MHKVMIFIGTRPEITKMAPIIRKLPDYNFQLIFIHSGQHYDRQMSNIFLKELELNEIDENLEVGSGSHGVQTARMLERYETVIKKHQPDIVLALGDTNSVVAASIICAKMNIPFGHIEAGIRSFDMTMPEEINRRFAAVSATLHFAPSKQAVLNLYYEGIDPSRVYLTGNTAIDATLEHAAIAKQKSKILEKLNLPKDKPLITLTVHRPGNVDNPKNLGNICKSICLLKDFTIVFPVHPRTKQQLEEFGLDSTLKKCSHIILTEPLGYLDFLCLMQESKIILTDSGGLQEEAFTLKKPCVTLRTNTERPETVKLGANFLVGSDCDKIVKTVYDLSKSNRVEALLENLENPYGDGTASIKILDILQERLTRGDLVFTPPSFYMKGSLDFRIVKVSSTILLTEFEKENKGKATLLYSEKGLPQVLREEIPAGWYVRLQY